MSAFHRILEKYRKEALSQRDKGARFERLMRSFLRAAPMYAGEIARCGCGRNFRFAGSSAGAKCASASRRIPPRFSEATRSVVKAEVLIERAGLLETVASGLPDHAQDGRFRRRNRGRALPHEHALGPDALAREVVGPRRAALHRDDEDVLAVP